MIKFKLHWYYMQILILLDKPNIYLLSIKNSVIAFKLLATHNGAKAC